MTHISDEGPRALELRLLRGCAGEIGRQRFNASRSRGIDGVNDRVARRDASVGR